MTTGERIQELRKREGLSQEQLGEKLNVTRQAISKWEGDVTLPEVEKLVALSRLFRVNVGVLLGVEEEQGEPENEGLTERELAAVEAVAARYAPAAPKSRRWPMAAAAALLVLALGGTLFWVGGLNRELEELKDRTESRYSSLSGQIASALVQQPNPPAVSEDDLFAAQSCEVESFDLDAGTVTLRLSVTPKRYVNGMSAQFTAKGKKSTPVSTGLIHSVGQTFTTLLACSLDDEITVTVAMDIDNSGVKDVRTLDTLYDLKKDSGITVNTWWEGSKQAAIEILVGRYAPAQPAQAKLLVKKDGAVVKEYPVKWQDMSQYPADTGDGAATAIGPTTYYLYPEENEDEAEFVAWVKDTAGREYTAPVEVHKVK